jgi:hypothetical protein
MTRASSLANESSITELQGLGALNRQPLTPDQQLQALKRVQAQAEQRVKLGMQLFKAAEARLSTHTDVLGQIKTLQSQLREQVNQDVAKSLHEYDQWIGQIDESFTTAIRKLEEKVDAVQANIVSSESRVKHMLDRAEALLDQSRCLSEHNSLKAIDQPSPSAAPAPGQTPISPIAEPDIKPIAKAPTESASKSIGPAADAETKAETSPFPIAPKRIPPAEKQASKPKQAPKPAPAPQAKTDIEIETDVDAEVSSDSHQSNPEQEKIYSTLLQRLIQDEDAKDAAKKEASEDDTPDENANAA